MSTPKDDSTEISDDGRIRMRKLRSKQGAAIAAAAIIGAGVATVLYSVLSSSG